MCGQLLSEQEKKAVGENRAKKGMGFSVASMITVAAVSVAIGAVIARASSRGK